MPYPTTLPMERGQTMSGTGQWLGDTFWDSDEKQVVQIVKNTDAAALTPKRMVKYEDASAFGVDYTTAQADGPQCAGVVDPKIAGTVAVNKEFYVVRKGICTCALGTGSAATAAKSSLICSADSDKGKLEATPAVSATLSAELLDLRDRCAIGQAVGSQNSNTEILLALANA